MCFLICWEEVGISMTRDEVILIMGALQVAYPKFYNNLSPEQVELTVNLWTKMLSDVKAEDVTLAVNKIIATSEWPPTIAEVRKAIFETQNGTIKESGEAWGEVTAAIRRFGHTREKEALESMSEYTRIVVKYINWQTICQSEDLMADRAHFLKIYEAVKKKKTEENQMPFFVKNKIIHNIKNSKSSNQTLNIPDDEKMEKISDILLKTREGRIQRQKVLTERV